MTHRVLYTEGS